MRISYWSSDVCSSDLGLACLHLNRLGLIEDVSELDLDSARGGGCLGRLADTGAMAVAGVGKRERGHGRKAGRERSDLDEADAKADHGKSLLEIQIFAM